MCESCWVRHFSSRKPGPTDCDEQAMVKSMRRPILLPMNTTIEPIPENQTDAASLAVFFDGSCPMCRREIGFYKRRRGADRVNWVDVSEETGQVAPGLSCEAAMARFNVRLPDGEIIDGGAAFAALWKELPAFSWLGRVFSVQPLKWALNGAYNLFLPLRPTLQSLFFGEKACGDSEGPRSV